MFALFAVWLRADQIITGTAVTLLAVGLTGTLYRALYGAAGAALSIPTTGPVPIPLLSRIPVIGPGLFDQPVVTYVAYVARVRSCGGGCTGRTAGSRFARWANRRPPPRRRVFE